MIIKLVIVLLLISVALLIYASTKPNQFRIERSIDVSAPPSHVFALINDFHEWRKWSPWEQIDPNMKKTYSGSATGEGSVYEWVGNPKVGQGRMEILHTDPDTLIKVRLDFLKPMKAQNTAEFTLTASADGQTTHLNWVMYGADTLLTKVVCLFFNRDKVVGKDFEKGLIELKKRAE